MKKIIHCIIVCCLLLPPPIRLQAQIIMHIASGGQLYIKKNASLALDSLVLKPSAGITITNTDIIKSETITHTATGTYISRVYRFSNSIAGYSGKITAGYLDNELNGLNENTIVLNAFTGNRWIAFRKNLSRDTSSNYVANTGLSGISLNEFTLADSQLTANKAPTVTITSPANNSTFTAPATITINALAADADGTISSVKFYNGSVYLKTVYTSPYTFTLSNLPAGTYSLTVKATDNSGAQTTSAAINISVKTPNKAPAVTITSPADKSVFSQGTAVYINAAASDTDGSITSVVLLDGTRSYSTQQDGNNYYYIIKNAQPGSYSFTAKATDYKGAETTSNTVRFSIKGISSKLYSQNEKTAQNDALTLKLSPNPTSDIVNIYTSGLQPNKPATLSIISVSGIVLKTMQISNSSTSIDVSSLASGVYTIKIISGKQSVYKKFVRL